MQITRKGTKLQETVHEKVTPAHRIYTNRPDFDPSICGSNHHT